MSNKRGDARAEAVRRPHVLVVEDDPSIREVVAVVLEDEGYTVDGAERPDHALEALSRAAYDLVLTDLFGDSAQTGLDAIRPIVESASPTPVGVCTAHQLSVEEARAAGFAFVLAKPFDVSHLLDCVAEQLADQLGA